MSYSAGDCCDGYTCTAWDGKGRPEENGKINHNLVEKCPQNVKDCPYRIKQKKMNHFMIGK
jgi:hypothetical protein